jgi:hypothetical protein
VDGKHVVIVPPTGAGSYFFNYKGYISQELIGIAYSNYEFINFNFGTNGQVSDEGILDYTDFYDKLQNECLKIPESSDVKGRKLPYVFVGDKVFSLRKECEATDKRKKIFNYRLSRAQRIMENVFGIFFSNI